MIGKTNPKAFEGRLIRAAMLAGLLGPFAACAPETQVESAGTSTNKLADNNEDDNAVADVPMPKCTKKSCPEIKYKVDLVDLTTGSLMSSLRGETSTSLTWGFKIVKASSGNEIRQVLVDLADTPSEGRVELKENTAVMMGVFSAASSGSIKVRWRDVDYCRVKHSTPADCSDIKKEIGAMDNSETFSYTIDKSAKELEIEQLEAKKKQMGTINCAMGIFGAFTGNMAGVANCLGMFGN